MLARRLTGLVDVVLHGDNENQQSVFRVLFVKLLEMNHLLDRETSVAREKADRGFGMNRLSRVIVEHEFPVFDRQSHGLFRKK